LAIGSRASSVASSLEVTVELLDELRHPTDDELRIGMEPDDLVTLAAIYGWEGGVQEVVVVLAAEPRDLTGELAFLLRARERSELLRGHPGQRRDFLVVVDVATVAFDDRVRLVDVLLADKRGDAVASVLRTIEISDLAFGVRHRTESLEDDDQNGAEEEQDGREARTEAAADRESASFQWCGRAGHDGTAF
jgi:hypothetical protein